MQDNKRFLQTLSKIMEDGYQPAILSDTISKIGAVINDRLLPEFNRTSYPSSPAILSSLNRLVSQLRTASTFPEMIGKRTIYIYLDEISDLIFLSDKICNLVESETHNTIAALMANKTDVPIILIYGDTAQITAVNYADRSIEVTADECEAIVNGCIANKTDLGGVLKAFTVAFPFKNRDLCIIIDMGNTTAFELFENLITDIFLLKDNGNRNIDRFKSSDLYRGIITADEKFDNTCGEKAKSFRSYEDCFLSVYAEIEVYYHRRLQLLDNTKKIITSDIVREGTSNNKLAELRLVENNDIERLTSERDALISVFSELRNLFEDADKKLSGICRNVMPRFDIDKVSERLFLYAESQMYEKLDDIPAQLERVDESEGREITKWLIDYIEFIKNGTLSSFAEVMINRPAHITDWKIAKVYAMVVNYEQNDPLIKECIPAIENAGKALTTGKELYIKAKSMSTSDMAELLVQSYEAGHTSAGNDLWQIYLRNEAKVSVQYMADLQIAEFCVRLSESKLNKLSSSIDFKSPLLLYLKFAAAKEYAPAVGLIVDTIYDSNFTVIFSVERNSTSVPYIRSDRKKMLAAQLVELCRFLISKGYRTMHYKNIAGLLLFLIRDMNASMKMLSGVNNKLSNYCKGYMYETGKGAVKSLEKAIQHYKKAGDAVNAAARIDKIEEKLEEEENDLYDSKKTYSSRTTYSSTSSGCFITTATCTALGAPDNCKELEAMRRFRDEHLISNSEGELLTGEYYSIAPVIVDKINSLSESEQLYRYLWDNYIAVCYEYIIAGKYNDAKSTYIKMVIGLCSRFNISLREEIAEKYGDLL